MTADDRTEVATYTVRVTRVLTHEVSVTSTSVEQAKVFATARTDARSYDHPDFTSENVYTQIIGAEDY